MTPDELVRLQERRWLSRATPLRHQVQHMIAQVLHKSPMDIGFTDFGLTRDVSHRFAEQVRQHKEMLFPDRSAAITLITTQLGGKHCQSFLLQDGYDDTGIIILDLALAVDHIDDLLKSQNECFRIMSFDAAVGACVTVEEGVAPHYPRQVTLWTRVERGRDS